MQRCNHLNDFESAKEIMDLLLANPTIKPEAVQFGIFINTRARADDPESCINAFNKMISLGIQPNKVIFGQLIKSLKRQGRIEDAQKFWNLMIDKYKIQPDEYCYAEMISVCAFSREITKATELYHEYLEKVNKEELPATMPVFSSYLNVFSRSGDIEGMQNLTVSAKDKFGFEFESSRVCMTDIMRGYIVARDYESALNIVKYWISSGKTPTKPMLYMKCVALCHSIRISDGDFVERHKLYQQLLHTIKVEVAQYDMTANDLMKAMELDGAIYLYRYQDPMEIVKVFRRMVEDDLIEYKRYDAEFESDVIDLHTFQPWQAQFIIRYLIGFECGNTMETLLKDDKVCFIVGIGIHTKGNANRKGKLREFVINELKSWDAPISCQIEKSDQGRIYIHKNDLLPYLQENNHAKIRLTEPSMDWYNEFN